MGIAENVASANAYLTDHPAEARYRDGAATATLEAGLSVSVIGSGGERLRTDMPSGIGGGSSAPSPGWFLRAATASCVVSLVAIRAAVTGVPCAAIEATVDSESDDRGILGLDDAIPAGPLSMRIAVTIRSAADPAEIEALVGWAVDHCPVSDAVARAVPVEVQVLAVHS
ncbi:MAG: OsmC family peroxiredoxin [Chloroflexota bacterium]|nr:MAG: OsmC family peroxiredoxin [Chloroflexota bacterium]